MTPQDPAVVENQSATHPSIRRPWVYAAIRWLVSVWAGTFFDLEITGAHRLPTSGPFLVLAKHQRWEDVPLVGLAIPAQRLVGFLAKAELFRYRAGQFFFQALGGFSLDRQRPMSSRDNLMRLGTVLAAGHGVVLFPEGTYYPNCMGPARIGAFRFLTRIQKAPLFPVGIIYHSKKGWRRRVSIHFGGEIDSDSTAPAQGVMNDVMRSNARLSKLEARQ